MKRVLARSSVALLVFACGAPQQPPSLPAPVATKPAERAPDEVTLQPLAAGVWVHVTWNTVPKFGLVASNGVLACGPGGGLLIDTAWNDAQTARLLDLAAARGCAVHALVVTHFHDDRMGGIAEVLRRGVPTYASPETVKLAHLAGWSPKPVGAPDAVEVAGVHAEVFFPGAGHAPDNVVVWLPASRVLFGGCMIRAADNDVLGNLSDADVPAWPGSVEKVKERYGQATHVVPGHGDAGGPALLDHTIDLARRGPK
jgi:metallo-beta-lactamase class B